MTPFKKETKNEHTLAGCWFAHSSTAGTTKVACGCFSLQGICHRVSNLASCVDFHVQELLTVDVGEHETHVVSEKRAEFIIFSQSFRFNMFQSIKV